MCKVNCQAEGYDQNDDVIVPCSQDVATLVAQLMPAKTVLHVSQTDIDCTIRSVGPWDNVQVIAGKRQMHAAEYSLKEMWNVSGQNDPSIELK